MSVLKTLGVGMYYRLRRISKAFKNWKKFGVVIFGSLFLVSSLFGTQLADASSSFHVSIFPTAATITLGSNKLFTAQAFNGINNVTDQATFHWTASQNGATVAQFDGSDWTYRPTSAGTYNINTRGTYTVDGSMAFADTASTLTVTDVPDARNYVVTIVQPTTPDTITLGGSHSYTATATFGTPVTDSSTFGWVVTKNNATVATGATKQFTFTPTEAGTYTINVRGIYNVTSTNQKTAWSEPATLVVNPVTPPPTTQIHLTVSIYPTATNPIMLGQSKLYTAQAFNGVNPFTSSVDFDWTASKNGHTVATSTGVTWDFHPAEVGTYTINARGTVKSDHSISAFADVPATLIVQAIPPTEVCTSLNIIPSTIFLQKNGSAIVDYTSSTNLGNPISPSNLLWTVTGGSFDAANRIYTGTQVGDFTITVQCRVNSAVRDSAAIHVSDIIINQETLTNTTIAADRNPLCLNESTNLSAQAKNNFGQNISDATYAWQWLGGVGYLAGNTNSQLGARFVAGNSVGSARVRVTATWHGQSVSNEMTIFVNDCSNPNNQFFIDGFITTATDDGKPVCAGSVLNYTITLTNRFNTVHGVRLSTSLPLGVTFMSASSPVDSPNIVGRTITWDPGTMTQGQSVTLLIKVKVNEDIRTGSNLRLTALVQADERPSFNISSGDLVVRCGGTTPTGPLPSTGMEIWLLAGLAVISCGLSYLTYRWFDRRMMNRI